MKKVEVHLLIVGIVLAATQSAYALQPVEIFLKGARTNHPNMAEARANIDAADAQSLVAVGRLTPSIALRGAYTRNQYETAVSLGALGRAVITPYDQLDASATVSVPLVNLANYWNTDVARTQKRSLEQQAEDSALQLESSVVQAYYQIIADAGLIAASKEAHKVVTANFELAKIRLETGKAASLEVDRAEVEVEKAVQILAAAESQLEIDKRTLRSLSGVEPDTSAMPNIEDDFREELPIETLEKEAASTPKSKAAAEERHVQQQQAFAQRMALLPTLDGSFTEKVSNAAGFSGHDWTWQAALVLAWKFDVTNVGNIRAQDAKAKAAAAREERTLVAARDAVHRALITIKNNIERCRSALKQAEVSRRASEMAKARYEAGAAAQLDLLQAERDAFSAEVNRIQTDADLANARAQLRLAMGRSLLFGIEVKQ